LPPFFGSGPIYMIALCHISVCDVQHLVVGIDAAYLETAPQWHLPILPGIRGPKVTLTKRCPAWTSFRTRYAEREKGCKVEFRLFTTENRSLASCLAFREKLHECRVGDTQNRVLAALVRPLSAIAQVCAVRSPHLREGGAF
jgi:hypothetical protein